MLESIKRLFRRSNPIVELGRLGKSNDFAKSFLSANVILLSLPISDSIDPITMTQDEVTKLIEKALRNGSNQTEVSIFNYLDGTDRVFPIFLSQKPAENFVKKYVAEINRVIPFQVIKVSSKILIPKFAIGMRIVLNPKNHDEYVLTGSDVDELINSSA